MIQSAETTDLTAEADDAQSAREAIEAQVPDGYDLIQVHNSMPRGGRVIATGVIRPAAVDTVEADGADYAAAKAAIVSQLPPGYRVLSYQVV